MRLPGDSLHDLQFTGCLWGGVIVNPGVPAFWPDFCLTRDVMNAAYLAWLLKSQRLRAVI